MYVSVTKSRIDGSVWLLSRSVFVLMSDCYVDPAAVQ